MMLANFNIPSIELLRSMRDEVPSEYSPCTEFKYKYFNKQDYFKSIDELNTYLNKLSDEDFELFTIQMIKILEEEKKES